MSRVRTRLEQYKTEIENKSQYKHGLPGSALDIVNTLLNDFEQDEKENGWIPVSEKLPEDEREYLVTLEKVYGTPEIFMGIASYLKFGNDGYWNEKKYGYLEWDKYSDGHGGTTMYKVIAWKPLPKPYEEG
ncbi:DUF551 domain-containing protein [Blautia obeum]|jgi:hypothetical protein|uniref:DUF551 domain-containing protein n=1 Tax=Blautia obeum TaxID=40520 RepID=A0A395XB56_9FIRM|nr:DUF551 domain-containing protein [Blautia obeum]RGV21848.1 DUF551 domain-containing protein [Blautia obeum]RGV64344.1 DUF551 domain-containing protein [Blautia obeum]DAT91972.1 MAG TPA: Protein of unknown function (DUF551) [Bacteriophage sp.]